MISLAGTTGSGPRPENSTRGTRDSRPSISTICSWSSSRSKDKSKSSNKRKLEKRLTFQAKIQDAVINLGAKKAINKKKRSRQRKLRAYDLSALSEFLPDLDVFQQPSSDATKLRLNCKSRQKLVQRESAQLKAVLKNSSIPDASHYCNSVSS